MRQNYLVEYVPNAYINLCVDKNQQRANNQLIYDFKAGKAAATRFCAELLINYLTRQYGRLLEDFVVVFAPCSAQWKYYKRFGYLAAILNQAGIKTANEFKEQLEAAGAYIEREIFVGRTIHHCPISNRGILQEMAEGFYEAVAASKRCYPQGIYNVKLNNNKAA